MCVAKPERREIVCRSMVLFQRTRLVEARVLVEKMAKYASLPKPVCLCDHVSKPRVPSIGQDGGGGV